MTSRPKLSLFPECNNEAFAFASDPTQSVSGPAREAPEVAGAEVGQFMLLPVGPEILHRIKFGRIGGEAARDDFAFQGFEVLADDGGPMDGGAVPDNVRWTPFFGQQTLKLSYGGGSDWEGKRWDRARAMRNRESFGFGSAMQGADGLGA